MDEEVKKTSGETAPEAGTAADTGSDRKDPPETAAKESETCGNECPKECAGDKEKSSESRCRKDKKDAKKLAEQLEAVTAERDALKKKLDEARDAHLRTLAEYDNYRKRTAREHDEIYPNATANAVSQFLPALDAFERGMSVKCTDESFHKGMEMVQNQMKAALEKLGCTPYGAPGDPFDPALHNAIMRDEDGDDADTPVITEVFQPGYKLGDKVVRFAMVKVRG